MAEIMLSEHFKLAEFYDPAKYKDVLKGKTAPAAKASDIDPKIISLLEDLRARFREKWSDAVIIITPHGGYRPDPLNALVGGASGSQHRYGRAADFKVKTGGKYLDAPTLAVLTEKWMAEMGVKGGLGAYDGFGGTHIHVDVRGKTVHWYITHSSAGCPGHGGVPCVYKSGTKGAGVCFVQRYLGLKADGKYGAKTAAAVKAFQKSHGLKADGVFGKDTNAAMGGVLPW